MYEQKSSELPIIQLVWRAKVIESGEYDDPAKDTWGLAFTKRADGTYGAELLGPAYRHKVLDGREGDEYWGVEFYPYVTMRGVNKPKLTGKLMPLRVEERTFFIDKHGYAIPAYEELEGFCETLLQKGIISLASGLLGHRPEISLRSRQRHNLKLTGLTLKQQQQIRRAERANALLKQGMKPTEVAVEVGYSDQAHMTRSLKLLLGKTPSKLN